MATAEHPQPSGAIDVSDRYRSLAVRVAEFLLRQQIVGADVTIPLTSKDGSLWTGSAGLTLRRGDNAVEVRARLRIAGESTRLWIEGRRSEAGPFVEGELFRVTPDGTVQGRPGFKGWAPGHNPGPDARRHESGQARRPAGAGVKAALKRIPGLTWASERARQILVGPTVAVDLRDVEGITFRIERIQPDGRSLTLAAYDRGGFYDELVNAEGCSFPPQVPGNYYADAYAALTFARLYIQTGRELYLDGCRLALEFVERVYPQYAPTDFVWHHSDFKNPALMETIDLLVRHGLVDQVTLERWQRFFATMQEDAYSPTNVFALRLHWHSARAALLTRDESADIERCLARLIADQTTDGLFHDNAPAYVDAHDLTYHQYTTACLAGALAWRDAPEVRAAFLRAARCSLRLTTPTGELAYVGRGSHNVYHLASAIFAFETAITMHEVGHVERGQFRRAARLLMSALERHQTTSGMLPTAMNPFVQERVAWNHCETPYNALSASLLLRASELAAAAVDEQPLPMECAGTQVLADAGFATATAGPLHLVVFSGCAESYAWSEGRHRTGVAGLAQLGSVHTGPLLPILDHPTQLGEPLISDLPMINGAAPYGRGCLSAQPSPFPTVLLEHAYGGARMRRLYVLMPTALLTVTVVVPDGSGALEVDGLVALPVGVDDGARLSFGVGQVVISANRHTIRASVLSVEHGDTGRPRVSPVVTNPRGRARRVELARSRGRGAVRMSRAVSLIRVGDGQDLPSDPVLAFDGESYTITGSEGGFTVTLHEDVPRIEGAWVRA